jgi:hypothetical protein
MKQKNLMGLGLATLAIVVVAFLVDRSREPVDDFSAQAGALVAGLGDHLNDVNRMTVTMPNKRVVVTLENKGDGWKVMEKGGYPADTGKLREYLLKVADARLIEKKTAKPDRFSELALSDISSPDAKGIAVELDGLAEPVSFINGVYNAQGGGTYVRRIAETQTWLASGNLIPDKDPANWLHKDLANIPSDRIASVTITHADGNVLRVFKDSAEDTHYTIADVPKGREPSSEVAANGLASVLSELRIEDVAPSSEVAVPEKLTRVRYATFDGVIVDISAWQVGDKNYVVMSASEDKPLAEKHADAELARAAAAAKPDAVGAGDSKQPGQAGAAPVDKAETDAQPARDRAQRLADISAEVEKLNAAFKGWSFVLPGYKISNINKRMDELLKSLEVKSLVGKPSPGASKK